MNKKDALSALDILAPAGRLDPEATFKTHWQAMACTSCMLAGGTPEDHFPQEPGLWPHPCPRCGEQAVWVTPLALREGQQHGNQGERANDGEAPQTQHITGR